MPTLSKRCLKLAANWENHACCNGSVWCIISNITQSFRSVASQHFKAVDMIFHFFIVEKPSHKHFGENKIFTGFGVF